MVGDKALNNFYERTELVVNKKVYGVEYLEKNFYME
jgi:hypothetical protein